MTSRPPMPAYLVRGGDQTLVADAVRALLDDLVGSGDAGLAVEETALDCEASAIVDAAQTPPFLSDRRVVVARDVSRFLTAQVGPLVAYLSEPLPTTSLVMVSGGGGQLARSLVEAVRRVGHVVDADAPGGKARHGWVGARLREAPVSLDGRAAAALEQHLGDDLGRLPALLEMLAAAYGPGVRLGVEEIEPFLGTAGSVAPWELTDAIDKGDTATALGVLARLVGPGGRHPLVVHATLHTHFSRMLRLDGAGVTDEGQAAEMLGMKGSTYPAAKALRQSRRLGSEGVARAMWLLADADLDLKGATGWPPEMVLEVLVARLSRLAGGGRRA